MHDAIGEQVKSIIEKYKEHKTLGGEHQIRDTSTLHSTQVRRDHLDDNQESARVKKWWRKPVVGVTGAGADAYLQ